MKTTPCLMLLLPVAAWAEHGPTPPARPEPLPDPAPEIRAEPPATATPPAPPQAHTVKLSADELARQPRLLHRALTAAVLRQHPDNIKLLLPLYLRLPKAQRGDKVLIELAQAALAEQAQRPGRAAAHYRNALAHEPDMPVVRLNLAAALTRDHQNRDADALLADIAADPALPERTAASVANARAAIAERRRWHIHAGGHYVRDANINNTPKQRVIKRGSGTIELPKPEAVQGFAYRAEAEKDWMLPKNHRIRTALSLNGRDYWEHSKYDELNVRAQAGPAYRSARSQSALMPYYERRWYSGSRYAAEKGLRVEHSRHLGKRAHLSFAGEAARLRHDRRRFLDGASFNASADLTWVVTPRSRLGIGTDFARKRAQDPSDAYRRRNLRATWGQTWDKGLNTSVHAAAALRRYDAADFFNITRRDTEYSLSFSVWHNNIKFWGITPRLVGVYQKNRSNHFMYDYQKAYGFIRLAKSI